MEVQDLMASFISSTVVNVVNIKLQDMEVLVGQRRHTHQLKESS